MMDPTTAAIIFPIELVELPVSGVSTELLLVAGLMYGVVGTEDVMVVEIVMLETVVVEMVVLETVVLEIVDVPFVVVGTFVGLRVVDGGHVPLKGLSQKKLPRRCSACLQFQSSLVKCFEQVIRTCNRH